jgi:mannose-6-phosphate isomerase-like protein (cupin superfamily)
MRTLDIRNAECQPNPHGVEARKLYDSEHAQVLHLTLKPGEALKRHITPVDVFFYVLEGNGTVEIGDEKNEVGPDTFVDSPARIPHRWSNSGREPLRILVTKIPRPKEAIRLL